LILMNVRHHHRYQGLPCGPGRLLLFISACVVTLSGWTLAADRDAGRDTIAVFAVPQASLQFNALSQRSVQSVRDAFNRLGRFMPVEEIRQQQVLAGAAGQGTDPYRAAAEKLKAGCYAVVSVGVMGNFLFGEIAVIPVAERYGFMKKSIIVRSMVPLNIPLKLAREIALLHKNLAVEADVIEETNGLHLLAAGQWQGLSPGKYRTVEGEAIIIRTCGRYQSIALLPQALKGAKHVTIEKFPSIGALTDEIESGIKYNTGYKYGLAGVSRGLDPEKRFVDALFIINPGANLLLPGYGAYLATSYLGFPNTEPSIPGIIVSTLLVITHFTLPEFMTKFKINFFPGVMDKDKTADLNNLQIFCWATLPLTVSAAFLDQVASQCATANILPPFFMTKDEAALALSAVIPGGGMFYKGHRLPGWGIYLSEMFLAGFCVYIKDDRKKLTYGCIALGAVKLIDLAAAYFSKPSYGFYNLEKEGRMQSASVSLNIQGSETGELIYLMGLSLRF